MRNQDTFYRMLDTLRTGAEAAGTLALGTLGLACEGAEKLAEAARLRFQAARVEGEVDLKGTLTVTTTGTVQGPITADVVRVAGDITGSITARESLCLERTGCVHGDVATASLIVENGRLDGSSTMLTAPERPKEPDLSVDDLQFGENYDLDLGSEQ